MQTSPNNNGNAELNGKTESPIESRENELVEEETNDYSAADSSDEEDDEYLVSDDNEGYDSEESHRIDYSATLSERLQYLTASLDNALDSLELDKSLVIQAQLSGLLNNESQKILEKQELLKQKIQLLKLLYRKNFTPVDDQKLSVAQRVQHDLKDIESRIKVLKHGKTKLFTKTEGMISKYPVEYNQAKDKILERTLDE